MLSKRFVVGLAIVLVPISFGANPKAHAQDQEVASQNGLTEYLDFMIKARASTLLMCANATPDQRVFAQECVRKHLVDIWGPNIAELKAYREFYDSGQTPTRDQIEELTQWMGPVNEKILATLAPIRDDLSEFMTESQMIDVDYVIDAIRLNVAKDQANLPYWTKENYDPDRDTTTSRGFDTT